MATRMYIQLWSYNYDPEPTGIAPLSAAIARSLAARGHRVEIVAAHPHYPEAKWGRRYRPYREIRDGLRVLRLQLWIGRATALERIRQEASFALSLGLAGPLLPRPDVLVAVSPSFPAVSVAMAQSRLRRVPWVLWLQDILPDGATATGILKEGALTRFARRFERAAYRSASHIVVISDSFVENLRGKDVPQEKLTRIYNPATRAPLPKPRPEDAGDGATALTMGNIGCSQNLVQVTREFEASEELAQLGARFVMAGDGVAADDVRGAIRTDRVRITGFLDERELDRELAAATVGVVSQRYEGIDFNVPSKLMNFMACGIPVVGAVRPDSEVARILRASGGGWICESGEPGEFARVLAEALRDSRERCRRGEAALRFARENFVPDRLAGQFERVLESVTRARLASPGAHHGWRTSAPPSTVHTAPVTYEASSEARKATTVATSSGVPARRRGRSS
jgi:colanic acid biosynthesis glycosyl transferase WcaI